MEYWARLIGGQFAVSDLPDGGTCVEVRAPMRSVMSSTAADAAPAFRPILPS
jgi:hypothetical protein